MISYLATIMIKGREHGLNVISVVFMGYFNERRDYIIYSDEKIEATGEEERAVGKGEDIS